jgi:hypothetical protein
MSRFKLPVALLTTCAALLALFVVPALASAATGKIGPPGTAFTGVGQEIPGEGGLTSIFTTNEGKGPFVGCKSTTFKGETEPTETSNVFVEPSYTECQTNIGGSLRAATVNSPGEWNLVVTSEVKEEKYSGVADIEPVTITVAGLSCTISVPAQTVPGLTGRNGTLGGVSGTFVNTGIAKPTYTATAGCTGVNSGTSEYIGEVFAPGIKVK